MAHLNIRRGLHLGLGAAPGLEIIDLPVPATLGVLPERVPFMKPRLLAARGDAVRVGTPLVADKRNPDVLLASPAGGRIAAIELGPRRVIREIVIERDAAEEFVEYRRLAADQLAALDSRQLAQRLMAAGLWPLMRQLPFRDYARPADQPRNIIVALDSKEPYQPQPGIYLRGREELFDYGLALLRCFGPQNLLVTLGAHQKLPAEQLNGRITHTIAGKYPAGEPGVTLYHTRQSARDNRAWYIHGQDLLLWAQFFQSGRYPTERVVAAGGNVTRGQRHYRTRLGVPLAHIMAQLEMPANQRCVAGGLFTGYQCLAGSHLGLLETSLILLDEGKREEFLALINPGLNKPTYSRLFASRLFPAGNVAVDCNKHGGDRACIACMHCADVCPVDILPQLVYKAILVEEVEEYLAHGLLDCAECGLCSYVCPSKIELTAILKAAKAAYYPDYNWNGNGEKG